MEQEKNNNAFVAKLGCYGLVVMLRYAQQNYCSTRVRLGRNESLIVLISLGTKKSL